MKKLSLASALALLLLPAMAETVKDRAGAVRGDRTAMAKGTRWIYNDWRAGFAEAKQTGKPLLVVLRCIPCLACAGIDASVLTEPELAPLLDQFVRVRVMNANALDLSLFQFDYDLSFSTVLFNADGTVYGRYGSWTHQRDPRDKTTAGFARALEGALALHKNYPENKTTLAGKQGLPMPVNDPLELPELAGKYKRELDWDGKVVQSCVHCHQIGDAVRSFYRGGGNVIPEPWIYPLPGSESLGFTMSPDKAAQVELVSPGSIADKAGLKAGDDLVVMDGQPLISIADVSWALHRALDEGALATRVKRDGVERDVTLQLTKDWRTRSDISRRAGTWPLRAMATGGLQLEDLSDGDRETRHLSLTTLALRVQHAGEYGPHAAAKNAGFRKEDILIELDGLSSRESESRIIGHLLTAHRPGEKLSAIVLRGNERLTLLLPMQ